MPQERMPSDDQAGRIMGQALISQARQYTYCLISEGEDRSIATAIAIEHQGHCFLATAGHVIPRDGAGIKVLLRNEAALAVSDFADRRWDSASDVGFLEIAPGAARHFQFLTLDAIEAELSIEETLPAVIVGYPAQFARPAGTVQLTTDAICRFIGCNSFGYSTSLLPRNEWPQDGLPDELGVHRELTDDDLLLDYDHDPFVRTFTAQTAGTDSPATACDTIDPSGMSGGGIWLAQANQSPAGILSPGMHLIGIQLSWYRDSNLLRGVRLGRWLDLVRQKY